MQRKNDERERQRVIVRNTEKTVSSLVYRIEQFYNNMGGIIETDHELKEIFNDELPFFKEALSFYKDHELPPPHEYKDLSRTWVEQCDKLLACVTRCIDKLSIHQISLARDTMDNDPLQVKLYLSHTALINMLRNQIEAMQSEVKDVRRVIVNQFEYAEIQSESSDVAV